MIEETGFKPLYHSYQGTRQLISVKPVYRLERYGRIEEKNTEYRLFPRFV